MTKESKSLCHREMCTHMLILTVHTIPKPRYLSAGEWITNNEVSLHSECYSAIKKKNVIWKKVGETEIIKLRDVSQNQKDSMLSYILYS